MASLLPVREQPPKTGLSMHEHRARYVLVCTAILFALFAVSSSGAGQALPADWTASNIANPVVSGSAVFSNNVFSVTGAGVDIWGSSDQFMFVHRQLGGDGVIVAHVASLVGTNHSSVAGVMFRESLDRRSKNAFVSVSTQGVALQQRPTTGASTLSTSGGSGAAPIWLKLERQSSTFTAFRSTDGVMWSSIGSVTVSMSQTVYVGLALSSYTPSKLALATFSNVSVGAGAPTVLPGGGGNQPPTVSLTAPASGASYPVPATITFAASAADPDGSVRRVDFYSGSSLIGSDTTSPYSASWSNVPAGAYTLTAVVRDNAGAVTTSAARTVTVSSNQPPSVSLTAPAAGATYTSPTSIWA